MSKYNLLKEKRIFILANSIFIAAPLVMHHYSNLPLLITSHRFIHCCGVASSDYYYGRAQNLLSSVPLDKNTISI
jgi:hypothetical protein